MFLNKMTLASLVVLIAMGLVCFGTSTIAATFPDGAKVADQTWKQGQSKISITFPKATATANPAGTLSATLAVGGSPFGPGDTLSGILTGLTFAFDANTGVGKLTGANAHNTITGLTLVTYTVAEVGGTAAVLPAFSVEIVAADPLIFPTGTTISDKVLIVGDLFSAVLPAAVGGVGPLTYSIGGTLPTGINFTPAYRLLTGIPTVATNRTVITYIVTDSAPSPGPATKNLAFTIEVKARPTGPIFAIAKVPDKAYTKGHAIEAYELPEADTTYATGRVDYTLTGLPTGLSFDGTTRVLTGTPNPTNIGFTTATYTATDAVGDDDSVPFKITVNDVVSPVAPDDFPAAGASYLLGQPFADITVPEATGGTGDPADYTYAVTGLPAGLAFADMKITGTPTAKGVSTVTITATDTVMATGSADFTITVTAAPNLVFTSVVVPQTYKVGTPITPMLLPKGDGGISPYTYALEGLPAGIKFYPTTRLLSGTPTKAAAAADYNYVISDSAFSHVKSPTADQVPNTVTLPISITVTGPAHPTNRPPDFGDATIPNLVATVGVAIPERFLPEATDADGDTLTYSISPALPTGLIFNRQTRALTGTPIAAMAQTPYTYKVADGNGGEDTINFSITINATTPIDVNGDGQVTVIDLAMVALFYGTQVPAGISLPADVNADGVVNILDLTAVAQGIDATSGGLNQVSQEEVKAAVSAATEQAKDLEEVAAAPMHFSIRPDGLSHGSLAYLNVANALADARHPAVSDVLSKFLELLAETKAIPETSALLPNYPNPFNPETWIPYHLAKAAEVTLTIYDVRGSMVRELVLGHQPVGVYVSRGRAAYWDGRNQIGEKVASGLYFYTLTAGDFNATRKLLIAK